MIYTSYYAMYGRHPLPNSIAIQISNSAPSWFAAELRDWSKFAPDWQDVKAFKENLLAEEDFKERYLYKLGTSFDKVEVVDAVLGLLEHYDNIVFLCYERPEDVCHRHYFSEWLDLNITELRY